MTDGNRDMRGMSRTNLEVIRTSAGKQLWEAQSAYISLLGCYTHPSRSALWLKDRAVIDYFHRQETQGELILSVDFISYKLR